METPRNFFHSLVHDLDKYRETSRFYRRTFFSDEDWVRYRSSGRLFKNLSTIFISGIVRGIWLEIVVVFLVSLTILALQAYHIAVITIPTIIFQLSSPALGLLLVFRTNTAYERWKSARHAWEHIQTHCTNLARQGMAYLEDHEKEEFTRRIIALAHIFKSHYRALDPSEPALLAAKLGSLLGADEAARLLASPDRPTQAVSDLCRIIRRSARLDGSTKARFDFHLDEVTRALVTCEGIRRMPVPLVYTRHTGRFLGLWTLMLPLALAREFAAAPAALVPASCLVSLFFFGIEELGLQIEEPFSIMPLELLAARVERAALQMLRHELLRPGDPALGPDARPLRTSEDSPLF